MRTTANAFALCARRPPIQAGLAASYMGSFKNNRSKAQLASHAKRRGEGQGSAAEDEEGEEGEDASQPTSYGARRASGKRQARLAPNRRHRPSRHPPSAPHHPPHHPRTAGAAQPDAGRPGLRGAE